MLCWIGLRFQFIRTDFSLLSLQLIKKALIILQFWVIYQIFNLLVLLVPSPLVDLRLCQTCGPWHSDTSFLCPVGVFDVLEHQVLHLLGVLSISFSLFCSFVVARGMIVALIVILWAILSKNKLLVLNHYRFHLLDLSFDLVDLWHHVERLVVFFHVGFRAKNIHLGLALIADMNFIATQDNSIQTFVPLFIFVASCVWDLVALIKLTNVTREFVDCLVLFHICSWPSKKILVEIFILSIRDLLTRVECAYWIFSILRFHRPLCSMKVLLSRGFAHETTLEKHRLVQTWWHHLVHHFEKRGHCDWGNSVWTMNHAASNCSLLVIVSFFFMRSWIFSHELEV